MLNLAHVATTRITKRIDAPRSRVYRALLDADAVRQWMVPDDMTSEVHSFDAREGGSFHISLTYDDPAQAGKTEGATDSYRGRFVDLVPDAKVLEVIEFETDDPDLAGESTISYYLTDAEDAGTTLVAVHENLPPGIRPEDNQLGWRMSIDKLARLVEGAPD